MRLPLPDPEFGDIAAADAIETIIVPRLRDIGPFMVKRSLPAAQRQMVGPFIFLDHFGPAEMISSEKFDVRPHPHIGLATVTYLYDGAIVHRDSIGSEQPIIPGDVNWMTAGAGSRIRNADRKRCAARRCVPTGSRCGWRCQRTGKRRCRASPTTAARRCR